MMSVEDRQVVINALVKAWEHDCHTCPDVEGEPPSETPEEYRQRLGLMPDAALEAEAMDWINFEEKQSFEEVLQVLIA